MIQRGRRFFATLDGIRGIAAIMVVAFHAAPLFGKGIAQEQFLAVDIFLSGAVVANAYEHRLRSGLSVLSFAKLRPIRLYPLYILGTAIRLTAIGAGVILVSADSAGNGLQLAAPLLFALLLLPDPFGALVFSFNPPAWSLFFELAGNIAYASVLRFLTCRVLAAIMAVSALGLAAILNFGPEHDLHVGWTAENLSGGFCRVGYSFFAGVLQVSGAASYAIYAIHVPLYWLILGMTTRMLHVPAKGGAPWAGLFFVALLLAVCWALDKFCDRPLRRFLVAHGRFEIAPVPEKA